MNSLPQARPLSSALPGPGGVEGGATAWQSVGGRRARVRNRRWRAFLWSLVYPYRGNRLLLTLPGGLVIAVTMGIGAAAYSNASNILFIALSLLLACLIFSGLLAWLNLKGVAWRLRVQPPLRVGREHPVVIEVRNRRRVLPAYGLWFELKAGDDRKTSRLPLRERLDPGSDALLEWSVKPAARGVLKIELIGVGSLFPFGFLRKLIGSNLRREVLVWPAPVEYQRFPLAAWQQPGSTERSARVGQGGDLLALRRYAPGDSPRLVHWKASARLRRLFVRQLAAETHTGFSLWVQTAADVWARPEQFELMCSLAATLAEDFFRSGRLVSVAIDLEAPSPVRRGLDLDRFLDRLALVRPADLPYQPPDRAASGRRANVLAFAPEGARGVLAYVDGEKTAAA